MRTLPHSILKLAETELTEDDQLSIDEIDNEFGEEYDDKWGLENILASFSFGLYILKDFKTHLIGRTQPCHPHFP